MFYQNSQVKVVTFSEQITLIGLNEAKVNYIVVILE